MATVTPPPRSDARACWFLRRRRGGSLLFWNLLQANQILCVKAKPHVGPERTSQQHSSTSEARPSSHAGQRERKSENSKQLALYSPTLSVCVCAATVANCLSLLLHQLVGGPLGRMLPCRTSSFQGPPHRPSRCVLAFDEVADLQLNGGGSGGGGVGGTDAALFGGQPQTLLSATSLEHTPPPPPLSL